MSNPVFNSVFQNEFRSLIEAKQAVGFIYHNEELALARLDKFFCENGLSEKIVTKELCDIWCRKRSYETDGYRNSRISILRVFCQYISSLGFLAYIPPRGMTHHPPKYDAHIFTDNEIARFFAAVDKSQSVPTECPYRGLVMPIFFRILYTTGMRVSELRLARLQDVNLTEGYIRVVNGKNRKDRLVPIHPELLEKCIQLKQQIHADSSEDEFFFMVRPGREMTLQNLYHNFRRYLEQAGISHTGRGPRIHDFRHTYCVKLLLKWVEEGKDLLAYMPYMRTMLGHESFHETAYYLKLTAAAYPSVRKSLDEAFPNIIEEVVFVDTDFY